MKTPLGDIGDMIEGVGKVVDDNTESAEERQSQLTRRHEADMASDNWLSKSIRPMTLIYLMTLETIIILADFYLRYTGNEGVSEWIIGQVGTLLFTAFGFYFNSKKAERVMEKKVAGAQKIEEMKIKAEREKSRRDFRLEKKEIRKNKKNDHGE